MEPENLYFFQEFENLIYMMSKEQLSLVIFRDLVLLVIRETSKSYVLPQTYLAHDRLMGLILTIFVTRPFLFVKPKRTPSIAYYTIGYITRENKKEGNTDLISTIR